MTQTVKVLFLASFILMSSFTFKSEDYLSKENLWKEIKTLDIKYPEFVFAQAILESGHFKSNLSKINNNLFGMKVPSRRETLAIGKSKSGYAIYKHWKDSVKDYLLFQNYILSKNNYDTKEKYIDFISRRYSETEGYVSKVNKVVKSNKEIFEL